MGARSKGPAPIEALTGRRGGATIVTVGCVFKEDERATAGLRAILDAGVVVDDVRLGAADEQRARAAAAETGVRTDLDAQDPLKDAPGLSSGETAMEGSNRGGVIGALVGACAGLVLGFTPLGSIVPVGKFLRPVADAMLFLALGGVGGAALGNALGRPRSTHAGFRLIDAMEEGAVAMVIATDADHADTIVKLLEENGATDTIRVVGEPEPSATDP